MEYLLESEVRPEAITFMAKKGPSQESYFDVWNRGEMHQIYKIKTSNVKGYKIKPPLFSIGVNERMRVYVTYLGLSDKPSKDRISVVYAHHANVKDTVQVAWDSAKQIFNTPEKRAYVTILFKEDQRRSIAEIEKDRSVMASVMGKSATAKPQGPGSFRLDPSGSSAGRDDSFYAPPTVFPKVAKAAQVRKKASGKSNCSTEPSEETNEDGNSRGKTKKKTVSQTVEAEDETAAPPPPPVKPRSRRKVHAPPPAEEEEEAPRSPARKPVVVRRVKTPPPVVGAAEPADDEMAEAPIAPKKTRKPVQQQPEEEEEEAPPPPPPKPAPKPRSRRKVQSTRPPANDEEEGTKKVVSPVNPRKSTSKPKPRKKTSGTIDPLETILGEATPKVVYIIQQGDQNDEDEEDSDRKARKKSSKDGKKKSKKTRKEEEEDEE